MHAIKWNESERRSRMGDANTFTCRCHDRRRRVCVKKWIFGIQFKLCRTTRSSLVNSLGRSLAEHITRLRRLAFWKIIKSFVILVRGICSTREKKHEIEYAINFMRTLFWMPALRWRWRQQQKISTEFYLCRGQMCGAYVRAGCRMRSACCLPSKYAKEICYVYRFQMTK